MSFLTMPPLFASERSITSSVVMKYRTLIPVEHATVPIATSMCVFPIPTGPNRTRFWAFLTNVHVVTSSRDSLGGSLTADQSYPSKVFGTGKFARLSRRLLLFASRKTSLASSILEIVPSRRQRSSP